MNERYRYGYGEDFPNRDFPNRDFPFSRQGAMTDQREEETERREAEVDERPERGDDDVEERQAERMREVHAADESRASDPGATMPFQPVSTERERPAAPAASTAAPQDESAEREAAETAVAERDDDAPAPDGDDFEARRPTPQTRRESIFEVGEEPADGGQARQAGEPGQAGQAGRAGQAERQAAAAPPGQVRPAGERPPIALGPPAPPTPGPAGMAAAAAAAAPTGPAAPTAPAAPAARPGQVGESRTSLLASIDRDSIRSRFVDIQAGFVDEPRQAVQEAERFVDELVHQLVGALEAERAKLRAAIDGGSTEDLRIALRGYRAFVDRLLNLTM